VWLSWDCYNREDWKQQKLDEGDPLDHEVISLNNRRGIHLGKHGEDETPCGASGKNVARDEKGTGEIRKSARPFHFVAGQKIHSGGINP
jgi:hypothetical protein